MYKSKSSKKYISRVFAYSVVFFSSSAYLFYHRWKYLSTHFLQRASVFRTIPVASFVFLCRKYIFTQSKKNRAKKTSAATLNDCYALYQFLELFFAIFFEITFLCLLRIKFCVVKKIKSNLFYS